MPSITDTSSVGHASGILPAHLLEPVLITPVLEQSVASTVSTPIATSQSSVVVPLITSDPAAAWVAEGGEIPASEAAGEDLAIVPGKIAGMTTITKELSDDASPDVSRIVGAGLARSIVQQLDAAYFGNVAAPAPSGLEALTGATTIDVGKSFDSLDPFIDAMKESEVLGFPVTAFVAHPDDVAAISKIKRADGSNERLLVTVRDEAGSLARSIDGTPLHQSQHVTKGTVWGIPAQTSLMVRRQEARIETSDQHFFSSDRIAIRAIMRIGFGFIYPPSIMKMTVTAP